LAIEAVRSWLGHPTKGIVSVVGCVSR
jgi:hypothetical protein